MMTQSISVMVSTIYIYDSFIKIMYIWGFRNIPGVFSGIQKPTSLTNFRIAEDFNGISI